MYGQAAGWLDTLGKYILINLFANILQMCRIFLKNILHICKIFANKFIKFYINVSIFHSKVQYGKWGTLVSPADGGKLGPKKRQS